MAIDYERLKALRIPDAEAQYTERDTMLYALSLGLGMDPLDETQLAYVYERGLRVLPTMAVVLAVPGLWIRDLDTGIDYSKVVLGSQDLELLQPLPAAGSVVSRSAVVEVIDKGEGRGVVLISRRTLFDKSSGDKLAVVTQTTVCRADGGFGGPAIAAPAPHPIPERPADLSVELRTSPQMALLYRLNGDDNPLHADPETAQQAGFPRPILHGLATFGLAGWAVVRAFCEGSPERLKQLSCRFTAPVFPGDTLRAEMWRDGEVVSYRLVAAERDVVVLGNGRAALH